MELLLESAKNIGMFIAEIILVLYFCSQYIKKYLRRPDLGSLVPKQNKLDLDIINRMDYVKEILNADRIHVYEFHNGEHYSDYRSSCKFSCSYEVVRAGKCSVRQDCVNLPISVMPQFIHKVTNEGRFFCRDIECIKDTMASTYAFKRNIEIKSFYDVALRNKNGSIIGFVAVHWSEGTVPNFNEDEINKLAWYIEEKIKESIKINR